MSREIKFRYLCKDLQATSGTHWRYSDWKYGPASFWEQYHNDYANEFSHLCQFIGFSDKNNKEIYHEHICTYRDVTSDEGILDVDHRHIGVVEWHDDRCALMLREIKVNHKGGRYWALWDYLRDIEIIGNVHEHPHLLEAKP